MLLYYSNRGGESVAELYFSELNEFIKNIWWAMPSEYTNYKVRYEKANDRSLIALNRHMKKSLKGLNLVAPNVAITKALSKTIKAFAIETLHMSNRAVDAVFDEAYFEYSRAFIKRAKELEPTLDKNSIFQALRNVWTMHSMQMYLGKEVELTDSVFAYSMLYPLTDNYLDDQNISKAEKTEFNKRFREKIRTGIGNGKTDLENKIFQMIDLIENEWMRSDYPKLYESVIGILDGQQLSLQQQKMESLFDKDLMSITFYKGGMSVLADAYLIKGVLSKEEETFAYFYGVILQLADDFQDIKSDLKDEHYTMMNIQGNFGNIDIVLDKFMHFVDYFFQHHYEQSTEKQIALKELSFESIQLLVFEAMMNNKQLMSRESYRKVCHGSHFSKRAYQRVDRDFNKQLVGLINTIL